MDFILGFIEPHAGEIIAFIGGAIASGIVWLTSRTSTKLDDDLVQKIADELKKKEKK